MPAQWLSWFERHGWRIDAGKRLVRGLPWEIKSRYPEIDKQWLAFIEPVRVLTNEDETVWFLCFEDYCSQNEGSFRWNEWEQLSLESAEDDAEWAESIRTFWNAHFPIILSVKNGYAYYALWMENGSIVYGEEPEFEGFVTVAASFAEFMDKIINGEIQL